MKYVVTITGTKNGTIEIPAESRKNAEEKALTISMNNPERFRWEESKYCVIDVKNKLIICDNCNAEIPSDSEYCNKCGIKVSPEDEIDLGRVYSAVLDSSCQTKTLFRKLYRRNAEDRYDTLLLHTRFEIISENGEYYPSFYIRKKPLECTTDTISTVFTITDIKNHFSPGRRICVDFFEEDDPFLDSKYKRFASHRKVDFIICQSFNKHYTSSNGDVFLEKPISFTAQKSDPNESGRMSTYYIVGINFKKSQGI